MPGSMIHLILAKKVNPEGSVSYFVGNIAPDAIKDRHDADATHFRDLKDRQPALISFAKEAINDFTEGILLHLYFDWKWDTIIRQKYINMVGDEWFATYRNELGFAGSYAFHHTDWAKQLWHDMDSLDVSCYGTTPRTSADDVKIHVNRNNKWHNDNITEPSQAFPPELIDSFTTQIAKEYIDWRASYERN